MANVKTIMAKKTTEIWSISPESSVLEAISMMADKNIGALTVVLNDKLVG